MTTEVALGALAAAGAAACYETSYALQALEARRVPVSDHVQVSLLARLVRRPLCSARWRSRSQAGRFSSSRWRWRR